MLGLMLFWFLVSLPVATTAGWAISVMNPLSES
jgi:hypothetical protein